MPWESKIPVIVAHSQPRTAHALDATGHEGEDLAKSLARVDTGFMRDQIRWHGAGFRGELVGHAFYTIYNELGTRYMSAQPMLGPAALLMQKRIGFHMKQVFTHRPEQTTAP